MNAPTTWAAAMQQKPSATRPRRRAEMLEQQLGGADASESDLQQRIAEANGRYKQAAAEKELSLIHI